MTVINVRAGRGMSARRATERREAMHLSAAGVRTSSVDCSGAGDARRATRDGRVLHGVSCSINTLVIEWYNISRASDERRRRERARDR